MDRELRAACRKIVRDISNEVLDHKAVDQKAAVIQAFVEERVRLAAASDQQSQVVRLVSQYGPPVERPAPGADRIAMITGLTGQLLAAGRHGGELDAVRRCVQEARLVVDEVNRQEASDAPLNGLMIPKKAPERPEPRPPGAPFARGGLAARMSPQPVTLSAAARATIQR